MPPVPNPNASFIPKQSGASKIEKKKSPRRFFLGTLLVRILFFIVIFVSVGVFFYERRLADQVAAINAEISSLISDFDVKLMDEVLAFDEKLKLIKVVSDQSFSITSYLNLISERLVQTVQVDSISISLGDDGYTAKLDMKTDVYDSVIAQREEFANSSSITKSEIGSMQRDFNTTVRTEGGVATLPITFSATLVVDKGRFPYNNTVSLDNARANLFSVNDTINTDI